MTKPRMAARSTAMTGPRNKRYTLQKTVMPRGTSREAVRNKATASQVRIRTDKIPRLLWGFAIRSAVVLIWPNDHHQRCEPAAKRAGTVTDVNGWLASAAWCGSLYS